MSNVIESNRITKRFGNGAVAVDGLDLSIRRGEVYGLLGPNGAGKTTTLRVLLGLTRPTSGQVRVLGHSPGDPRGLAGTGALVEEPALYPYLSGTDNLRVLGHYSGTDADRIDEVLDTVELTGRARDKVKTYSLGMRQRLGVAAALLKDPELLILDEPSNGLDPKGMAEMRTLVRSLGTGGRTVLLSSHLLAEVEQICDRVGIISRGRMVAEGSVDELRGGTRLVVGAEPLHEAEHLCASSGLTDDVRLRDGELEIGIHPGQIPDLNATLVAAGIRVHELRPVQRSLEATFLELTQEVTV